MGARNCNPGLAIYKESQPPQQGESKMKSNGGYIHVSLTIVETIFLTPEFCLLPELF